MAQRKLLRWAARGHRSHWAASSAALLGAALATSIWLAPTAPAHANNEVIRAAQETQKAVQRAIEQAERDKAKRQQEAARQAAQDARQAAQAERAAQQRKARADNEARKKAAKEKFLLACTNIQNWASPNDLPYFSGGRASPAAIVALLRADHFEPIFGGRYEDMPDTTLREISALASLCLRTDGPLAGMGTRERTLILQALSVSQQSTHKRYLESFEARDAALQALADEALTLQPTKEGAKRWREITTQAEPMLKEARPATRQAYQANMKKADTAVVVPLLPGAVEDALAAAKDLDGLRVLANMADRELKPRPHRELLVLEDAGNKVREDGLQRVRAGMDTLAKKIAVKEKARIDALGTGLVALEQGKTWLADYTTRMAPYADSLPQLGEVLAYFRQQREAALKASATEFQRLIDQAPDQAALQTLQARYLTNDDTLTPSGTALTTAFAQRRQDIDKRLALGRPAIGPSEPQAALPANRPSNAATGGSAATSEASGGEPSEEVMYDLVHSVLADATARQNEMMVKCSRGVSNDMMMNQVCAVLMLYKGVTTGITTNAPVPKILQFEKLGCAPATGKAGFLCDYTLGVETQLHPSIAGPEAKALLEGSTLKSARFIESRSKGWMMIYSDDAVR